MCGFILDLRVKLTWSKDIEKHYKVLQPELAKLTMEDEAESSNHDEEPQPKSKLFSFIAMSHSSHKMKMNHEQEFKMYLSDIYIPL